MKNLVWHSAKVLEFFKAQAAAFDLEPK